MLNQLIELQDVFSRARARERADALARSDARPGYELSLIATGFATMPDALEAARRLGARAGVNSVERSVPVQTGNGYGLSLQIIAVDETTALEAAASLADRVRVRITGHGSLAVRPVAAPWEPRSPMPLPASGSDIAGAAAASNADGAGPSTARLREGTAKASKTTAATLRISAGFFATDRDAALFVVSLLRQPAVAAVERRKLGRTAGGFVLSLELVTNDVAAARQALRTEAARAGVKIKDGYLELPGSAPLRAGPPDRSTTAEDKARAPEAAGPARQPGGKPGVGTAWQPRTGRVPEGSAAQANARAGPGHPKMPGTTAVKLSSSPGPATESEPARAAPGSPPWRSRAPDGPDLRSDKPAPIEEADDSGSAEPALVEKADDTRSAEPALVEKADDTQSETVVHTASHGAPAPVSEALVAVLTLGVAASAASQPVPGDGAEQTEADGAGQRAATRARTNRPATPVEVVRLAGPGADSPMEEEAAPTAGPSSNRIFSSLAFNALVYASTAAAVLFFAAGIVPNLLGLKTMIVTSGSMEPTISVGDAALINPGPNIGAIGVGDIITFNDGAASGMNTHRVILAKEIKGRMHYQTKGDANATPDVNLVPWEAVYGKVEHSVPRMGYMIHFASTPAGKLVLIALPLTLMMAKEAGSLLQSRKRQAPDVDLRNRPGGGDAVPEPT